MRDYDDVVEDEMEEQNQFLTFTLMSEVYGLSILSIKEILEYGEVTHVPMMPPYMLGVLNLRGHVVPVVDLAMRLGSREGSEVGRRTCVVIVEVLYDEQPMEMGLVVDAVNEALHIADEEIESAPRFGSNINIDFVYGMAKLQDRFVILLNIEKVLALEEWLVGSSFSGVVVEERVSA